MTTPPIPPGGDGPPQEPMRKKSTRRNLAAKLPKTLADEVSNSMEERSKTTIANARKLQRMVRAIEAGKPLDAPTEENRLLGMVINQTLKEKRERQQKLAGNRGLPLTGTSLLTKDGQSNSVKSTVAEVTDSDDREFAKKFGQRRGDMSTTPGEVHVVNPGLKVGEQTLQLLGHLAQLYMNLASDMEYQVLLVNNRLLVASNDQDKIGSFRGKDLQAMLIAAASKRVLPTREGESAAIRTYLAGALAEALRRLKSPTAAPLTTAQQDGSDMLAEYQTGYHLDHASRKLLLSLLSIVQHQAVNKLAMHGPVTPAEAVPLITDPALEYAVIGVKPPALNGWHAEQALVMALILANWQGGAAVGGTKLPCFTCWLTLSLVNQCGFPLMFIPTPGLLWQTTTLAGLTNVAQQLKVQDVTALLSQFQTAQSMTGDGFGQFMTALKTQTNLIVNTDLTGKEMSAQGLTQNQSQKSFYFGQYAPTPKDLPGEEPDSPVGTYGTPPNSPGVEADDQMELEYQEQFRKFEEQKKAWDEKEKEKKQKQQDKTTTS